MTCDGDDLVVCEENEDGCLVETRTDCSSGDTDVCNPEADPPRCEEDPCADVDNACDDEGTSCDGNTLVECEENEDGCLVATETDCTDEEDKNTCVEAQGAASCEFDPCLDEDGERKENVCVEDETMCAGDFLVTCVADADGCKIATRTDCTMPGPTCTGGDCNVCNAEADPPACDRDPCKGVTQCLTAGDTCRERQIIRCEANTDGCLVETVVETCDAGENCDNGEPPVCQACTNDEGCESASEGDRSCDTENDVLQTCTDNDEDGCLDLVTENCGDSFTCSTENGCVYDGSESCAAAGTLRESGSFGPFDTTGAGNDYNNYNCPGLIFPFAAAAPDQLFRVDVPAGYAIKIRLTGPTGFTGSGAWMTLMNQCAASNSEASCSALSNTEVGYANTTDATVRRYLVVDADNPQNGQNVGQYGLEVDLHPIDCGDGILDGEEECDDGNVAANDGCTPACELQEGFLCTRASPSVCTTRPDEPVCANVECPELPGTLGGSEVCCTPQQTCGVAYDLVYGAGCLERNQQGVDDEACPDGEPYFPLFSSLPGCCRPDNKCGVRSNSGAGCVERTEAWRNMQDGYGVFLYDGPFEAVSCTYQAP